MGHARGASKQGDSGSNRIGWHRCDPGSQDNLRKFLAGGEGTRFKRKHPLPLIGERFHELTVTGFNYGPAGGVKSVRVSCACSAAIHNVDLHNLLKGATTRCNTCAQKKSKATVKNFWKYAAECPNDEHRRRLLCRFSAAVQRCHNPKSKQRANYGGRGISVALEWRENKALFLRHVVTLDGWDNPALEMDRIDTDGNYEPGNIRFITKAKNSLNKRSVQAMQRELDFYRLHIRSCQCGAALPVYDPNK